MPEKLLRPNYDKEEPKYSSVLPPDLHEKIKSSLEGFEYSIGSVVDVAKHILVTDVEIALEDSVPMFVWFKLQSNKAKEREEYFSEHLKAMEGMALKKESKEKITVQKAGVYESETYKKCQTAVRKYRKIRRDCEDLAEAMKLRKEIAQTKSADSRKEVGGYQTR